MKYVIVEGKDVEDVCRRVSEMIDAGWNAAGGVSVVRQEYEERETLWWYAQAMVLNSK